MIVRKNGYITLKVAEWWQLLRLVLCATRQKGQGHRTFLRSPRVSIRTRVQTVVAVAALRTVIHRLLCYSLYSVPVVTLRSETRRISEPVPEPAPVCLIDQAPTAPCPWIKSDPRNRCSQNLLPGDGFRAHEQPFGEYTTAVSKRNPIQPAGYPVDPTGSIEHPFVPFSAIIVISQHPKRQHQIRCAMPEARGFVSSPLELS